MLAPVLNNDGRLTIQEHVAQELWRNDPFEAGDNLFVGELTERLRGLQLQPVFARDTIVTPLDLEEECRAGPQTVVPPQPHFAAPSQSIEIGLTGR